MTAENVHDIAITGEGAIDGNRTKRGGPKTIAIKLCQRVTIRGITVRNSPNYSISFWGCDFVNVDGVNVLNGYADGIDPDSSRYVRISNSYIDSWDDAICPKASPSMGMDQKRRGGEPHRHQLRAADQLQQFQVRHGEQRRLPQCHSFQSGHAAARERHGRRFPASRWKRWTERTFRASSSRTSPWRAFEFRFSCAWGIADAG